VVKPLLFTIYRLPSAIAFPVLQCNTKKRKLNASFIINKLFGEIMFRKTFYMTAILTASLFVGCRQDNPTLVDSTLHKHEVNKSASHGSTAQNSMNHGETSHNAMNQNSMNHNSPTHPEMNHSEMKSAPNAASQPYDLQFLDTMIAHHEGAVEMAKPAAAKAENTDLKLLAAKISIGQQEEILRMKMWREQWFAGKPSALNMEMAGMADSMKGMDMMKMNQASGAAFDSEFVNQMTPHHQGAIVMAREALTKAEHAEIKMLANQIIQAQEAEIKLMQSLKTQPAK